MIVEKVGVDAQLTTTAASLYSTSVKALAVIRAATCCNAGTTDALLAVWLTPPGIAPDASNAILLNFDVAAQDTEVLLPLINHVLPSSGYSIQAMSNTASALTLRISIYERAIT